MTYLETNRLYYNTRLYFRDHIIGYDRFAFANEQDATIFLLRWQ